MGFTDVNSAGDVVWVGWADAADPNYPAAERIMHANANNPGVVSVLAYTASQNGGQRLRISTDSDRLAFRVMGDGSDLYVDDLSDATAYQVGAVDPLVNKIFSPGISDDGNYLVANVRGGAGTQSDIWMWDLSDILNPVITPLFGNTATTRNDPRMALLDANTAAVVWDENASGSYDVMYAIVDLTGTPTVVSTQLVAGGAGDQRFADITVDSQGNILVAWLDQAQNKVAYAYIPEPASLALLALGSLALIRRR
jgi:hypothetical protein